MNTWARAAQTGPSGELPVVGRREAMALAAVATLTILAGVSFFRRVQAEARASVHQQLDTIANLKAAQLGAWRNERLGEARFLLKTTAIGNDVAALMRRPEDPSARGHVVNWLEPIRSGMRYKSVSVHSPEGELRLTLPAGEVVNGIPTGAFREALTSGDVVVADLHVSGPGRDAYIDLLIPIQSAPTASGPFPTGNAIAVIVLRLDPNQILFPLIQEWPVPSPTAETLLVRREGDSVVFLNRLRHRSGDPLTLRRSVNESFLPAAMAARSGEVSVSEGIDYRNVAVLFTSRLIPGTAWILVSKIDQSEAFAPARREAKQTLALATLVLLAVAAAFGSVVRQRRNESLRRALAAETERSVLAERLRLALAAARQGLYDLNVQTGEAQVTPEYAEMLGHDPETFRETNSAWIERLHPDDRDRVAKAYQDYVAGRLGEYRVEFRQRTRTGDWKWILSLGKITDRSEDGAPLRMLGTHTDITDRKLAEEALKEKSRLLVESQQIAGMGGWALDVPHFKMTWSEEAYRLLGVSKDSFPPTVEAFLSLIAPADVPAIKEWGRACIASQSPDDLEFRSIGPDGESRFLRGRGALIYSNDGRPLRLVGTIQDVTEGRRSRDALQASLREKEALLKEVHHRVKNNLQVIASLLRLETSRSKDPNTQVVLKEMQSRIRSMALLHETLYRTGNFAQVNLADYLKQLATQLFRMQNVESSRVQLVLEVASVAVNIDQAIPCGLIVNELLTNALKYAFAGSREGEVRLGLATESGGRIRLTVADTGQGLPKDFDTRRDQSLGLHLVADLTKQLGGALEITNGPGARFTVTFTPHGQPSVPLPTGAS